VNCMGCGGSKLGGSTPKRKSKVDDREDGYDRRPKVSVRMGLQVGKCVWSPRIIFIFGKYSPRYCTICWTAFRSVVVLEYRPWPRGHKFVSLVLALTSKVQALRVLALASSLPLDMPLP